MIKKNSKKIVAIIQARMGSTRLPGKMMKKILGKPIIEYVFERAKKSRMLDEVWLATTISKNDDVLAAWAEKNHIPYYRGSVDDVLDRYYQTAMLSGADVIVRLTGDCPLLDPDVVDLVVKTFMSAGVDYVSNVHPSTYPDGLDTEVFSKEALKRAWKEAKQVSEREHVTPYIWKNTDIFSRKNVSNSEDFSSYRWTLDEAKDLVLIKKILSDASLKNDFRMADIINAMKKNPSWLSINKDTVRNEGYEKSLKQDENYIVATVKPWNIENFSKHFGKDKNYHLVTQKEDLTLERLEKINPRYIFFPHWSWIIPKEIYSRFECVVFHMTDLPFGRGGSPLQNLIVRGIYDTKISAIRVDEGIDTGPVYLKKPADFSSGSAEEIYTKVSGEVYEMISEIVAKKPEPKAQQGKAVVWKRRKPEDSRIPEDLSPQKLYDFIRMLDAPDYPRAFLEVAGHVLRFGKAKLSNGEVFAEVVITKK